MNQSLKNHFILAVFSATLFLSAALMFSFQPMIGKMLLPIVGGAPSGWMVALAFFQVVLLAGYYAAHLLSRQSPRRQAVAYLALLALGSLFLPVTLAKSAGLMGPLPGPFDTLLLLTRTIAVPFLALSATSSTLQRLFTATGHTAAGNPYFLYVSSNIGSFAGLFLYPFVIEPGLRLSTQSACWLFGYLFLIVLAGLCVIQAPKRADAAPRVAAAPPVPLRQRLRWITLAFVPSGLMMGLTFYATTQIVSMPLLWVIPLGLYLLTFIVAFSNRNIVSLDWLARAQTVVVPLGIATIYPQLTAPVDRIGLFALHCAIFTVVALMSHLMLARSKPVDSARHLTLFYLMLAAGGALGGVLVAFVAPAIFDSAAEYPILLIAACFLNPSFRFRRFDAAVLAVAALLLLLALVQPASIAGVVGIMKAASVPIVLFTLFAVHPRAAIIGCAVVAFAAVQSVTQFSVYEGRNFYGISKVYDVKKTIDGEEESIRFLSNGTIVHGGQSLARGRETTITSYYTKDGPLGDVFKALNPKDIAVVGLGTGTISCYGTPSNKITFFEINPQVAMAAKKYFTFLSKCSGGDKPEIVMGDARLSLSGIHDRTFDLIILDAFASDAVPTHLMTKEAIAMYFDRLTENGIVLFHISNLHFSLGTPLVAEADALGVASRFISYTPASNPYAEQSTWVAMARSEDALRKLSGLPWQEYKSDGVAPWTDDYDDLISIMHF
jgi:spermidine synthase